MRLEWVRPLRDVVWAENYTIIRKQLPVSSVSFQFSHEVPNPEWLEHRFKMWQQNIKVFPLAHLKRELAWGYNGTINAIWGFITEPCPCAVPTSCHCSSGVINDFEIIKFPKKCTSMTSAVFNEATLLSELAFFQLQTKRVAGSVNGNKAMGPPTLISTRQFCPVVKLTFG